MTLPQISCILITMLFACPMRLIFTSTRNNRERLHIEAEKRKQKEVERLANMGEMLSEEEMSVTEFDKPADMIPEGGEDEGGDTCIQCFC